MHPDIEEYLEEVEASKAETTYRSHLSNLRKYQSWLDEQDLTPLEASKRDIHRFLREQSQQYASGTAKNRYFVLKKFYDYWETWDAIEDNPFEDLEAKTYTNSKGSKKSRQADVVYVTPDEKEAMCEHVPSPQFKNEFIIRLLWQTGLRRGEVVILETDNIDREERAIRVWSPKVEKWRTVFYQPSLDFYMNQWLDGGLRNQYLSAKESPYLFPAERAEHHRGNYVNVTVREAAKNAGINEVMYEDSGGNKRYRITAHALRHGHAVHALKQGIDIKTVCDHMGHESIDVTEKYLQLIDDDVKEAYRRFTEAEA